MYLYEMVRNVRTLLYWRFASRRLVDDSFIRFLENLPRGWRACVRVGKKHTLCR